MKTFEYSINNNVWVKLNPIGKAMWKQFYAKQGRKAPDLPPEEDGWTKFKMHKLMLIFGPGCFAGADLPFAATMKFEDSKTESE